MIYLATDHRGFQLKEKIKQWLIEKNYPYEDVGAFKYDKNDDYPDFAYAAAVKIAVNPASDRGVFLCGSGMGMDVAANKVKGIRATVAYSQESVRHARTNDDINVITLAGDILDFNEAKVIVEVFLITEFSGEERHVRRLKKIEEVENRNFK